MEEKITLGDMKSLAVRLVRQMNGKGGVAIATACHDPKVECEHQQNGRHTAILYTQDVVNRLKTEVEDVYKRVLDVSSNLSAGNIEFALSHIPTFAFRIADGDKHCEAMVVAVFAESVINYTTCLATINDAIAVICDRENCANRKLSLVCTGCYGGVVENEVESIYADC